MNYYFYYQNSNFFMLIIIFPIFIAISQAFVTTCNIVRKEKYSVFSCEHCPMYWYNKLCQEIEGKIFIPNIYILEKYSIVYLILHTKYF